MSPVLPAKNISTPHLSIRYTRGILGALSVYFSAASTRTMRVLTATKVLHIMAILHPQYITPEYCQCNTGSVLPNFCEYLQYLQYRNTRSSGSIHVRHTASTRSINEQYQVFNFCQASARSVSSISRRKYLRRSFISV